jgi:hypothetical protein
VQFSVALAGFVRSQVIHFHPLCSKGGFIPTAPQLNPPPVPLLVVEGVGPDPGKLRVNPDPAVFDVPNKNPDEVVDTDEVELDVPNRKGPKGGVGMEKPFPEPEPEEDAPGLGVSHTVHSLGVRVPGFWWEHAEYIAGIETLCPAFAQQGHPVHIWNVIWLCVPNVPIGKISFTAGMRPCHVSEMYPPRTF